MMSDEHNDELGNLHSLRTEAHSFPYKQQRKSVILHRVSELRAF